MRRNFEKECEDLGWKFLGFIGDKNRVLFEFENDKYVANRAKFPPKKLTLKNAENKAEWLINFLNKKHEGKGYSFKDLKWTGYFGELKGFCESHGEFYIKVNKIYESKGCKECGKNNMGAYLKPKDVTVNFREVHGDKYDYSEFEYINNHTPSTIICKLHGRFKQTSASHLRGSNCPNCSEITRRENRKVSLVEFLEMSRKHHGDFYDYSNLFEVWNGTKDHYIFICPDHGEFRQQAYSHAKGRGCSQCNGDGWSKTSYVEMARKKNKGKIKLYLIKLSNENETFYKIGITIKTIEQRSYGIVGYSVEEVCSFDLDASLSYDLEKLLLNEFSEYSYLPKISFGGKTECFSFVDKSEFEKLVKCIA